MKKINILSFIMLLLIIASYNSKAQRITVTLAGTGADSLSGDGRACKLASLYVPADVCSDVAGNLYIADGGNRRIRKVSAANGIITTYAGGGTSLSDGIPATDASISPERMCIDGAGNIYVSSALQVKRIDAGTGIIHTFAGTTSWGYSGDGGPATAASFYDIMDICIDLAGNVYIVDQGNYVIRKIAAGTGIVTTIAGTGAYDYTGDGGPATAATLGDPMAIAVDTVGNVFFSDQNGTYIRKINAVTGFISTIAGNGSAVDDAYGGPATATALGSIDGMRFDDTGNLYMTDLSCSCTKIEMSTGLMYMEAGSHSLDSFNGDGLNSLLEFLNSPRGLWVDQANNIYIADLGNNRIRKAIQLTHTPTFAYGKGEYIYPCAGSSITIDSPLIITDIDSAQPETWTVVTPPLHGALSGFPAVTLSLGVAGAVSPTGLFYTLTGSYSGLDSFQVRVSDGLLSDTINVYVSAGSGVVTGPSAVCAGSMITLGDVVATGAWSASNTNAAITSSGIVSGVHEGSDTIMYIMNGVCGVDTSEKVMMIDTTPPASAGEITGPSSVCAGSVITLADTITGGGWDAENTSAAITPTGIVTGISAGTDTLVYTVSNACGMVVASLPVTVNPLPVAGSISGETTVCIASTITLADSATGGIWSAGNGNSTVSGSGIVAGVSAGTDTIQYTVTNSCGIATTTQPIEITDCALGIQKTSSGPVINIFPNPVSNILNMVWGGFQSGNARITIADVTGRVVFKGELINSGAGNMDINVSGMEEGIYLLSICSDSVRYTGKIAVSR